MLLTFQDEEGKGLETDMSAGHSLRGGGSGCRGGGWEHERNRRIAEAWESLKHLRGTWRTSTLSRCAYICFSRAKYIVVHRETSLKDEDDHNK